MKVSSSYSNVLHDVNSNPFSASATRDSVTVTESTLSQADLENNPNIESAIKNDDGTNALLQNMKFICISNQYSG